MWGDLAWKLGGLYVAASSRRSCALGGTLLVSAVAASAGQKARVYVTLEKLCTFSVAPNGKVKAKKPTLKDKVAPVFYLTNKTNKDITVTIHDRYYKGGLSSGPLVVKANDSLFWYAPATWPWQSTYKPDKQYFAHFGIDLNNDGDTADQDEQKKTHEFCDCGTQPPGSTTTTTPGPTTSSTSTSTTAPTTTTTFRT
jgi:hypothetical protein